MSLKSSIRGFNFKDPSLMLAHTNVSSNLAIFNAAASALTFDTTSAFTGIANFGIQDTTDWTANTYKTIYSHTGAGVVYAIIGCTAGGAETTTFEITIDGVLKEITITNANTERAVLICANNGNDSGVDFTTATQFLAWKTTLDSSTLSTFQTQNKLVIPAMRQHSEFGIPGLQYDVSCLIRAKHSTSITNSTATAFSAVMVRKRIAA